VKKVRNGRALTRNLIRCKLWHHLTMPTPAWFFFEGAMIDPTTETLISLANAAKSLPGRPNVTTIWRWRNRGCRGVRLETVLSGGRRYTSIEALRRFQNRVNAAADGEQPTSATPKQRERRIERAERRAEALGI
jgi:hypothetical protein